MNRKTPTARPQSEKPHQRERRIPRVTKIEYQETGWDSCTRVVLTARRATMTISRYGERGSITYERRRINIPDGWFRRTVRILTDEISAEHREKHHAPRRLIYDAGAWSLKLQTRFFGGASLHTEGEDFSPTECRRFYRLIGVYMRRLLSDEAESMVSDSSQGFFRTLSHLLRWEYTGRKGKDKQF